MTSRTPFSHALPDGARLLPVPVIARVLGVSVRTVHADLRSGLAKIHRAMTSNLEVL